MSILKIDFRRKNVRHFCLYASLVFFVAGFYCCSSAANSKNAKVCFITNKYDFGVLKINQKAAFNFEFQNSGRTPLIIYNVKTSCGCTVPQWPKKPVSPGEKGTVRVQYSSPLPGVFNKSIMVYYNGSASPDTLFIRGAVKEADNK